MKSAEMLAVGWLETKLPEELEAYRHVMKVAHLVIREAFSNKVITPGKTTNEDVVWWMRQRVVEMGLGKWFHPSITIHRQGGVKPGDNVIQRGDMLHTDFGLVYLGFSTDTQHNAYVLKPGETDAPQGLKDGLKAGNRLQDLTMQFAKRRAHRATRRWREARGAGDEGRDRARRSTAIPIGYHGHGAGPPIGMTDYQEGVPVRGDYVFRAEHVALDRAERDAQGAGVGRPGRCASRSKKTPRSWPDGKWDWIDGRQTTFYLIK